jgi:hypothetical protein
MPKSTDYKRILSDDDMEAMFVEPQMVRHPRSMIETLTLRLSSKEQQMLISQCKDIYNQYGFKPTKAQIADMYRKMNSR